jgi:hypothetical protein
MLLLSIDLDLKCRVQSVWSDRRRCADRGLGCVFIKARSSEPQAEGSRS